MLSQATGIGDQRDLLTGQAGSGHGKTTYEELSPLKHISMCIRYNLNADIDFCR